MNILFTTRNNAVKKQTGPLRLCRVFFSICFIKEFCFKSQHSLTTLNIPILYTAHTQNAYDTDAILISYVDKTET